MSQTTPLSAQQVRAARALLDWPQDLLAEKSGLSVATIRKIESGSISPRGTTNEQIQCAFEAAGIEFLPSNGVRQKPEEMTTYWGSEGAIAFFDDVYNTALRKKDDIVVVCRSERPFTKAVGAYSPIHLQRMAAIKNMTKVKCILTEDFSSRPCDYCEYRGLPKGYIDAVPFYIYGDNYAVFLFEVEPSPKIIVLHSAVMAKAYRQQFNSMWEKGMPLECEKETLLYR